MEGGIRAMMLVRSPRRALTCLVCILPLAACLDPSARPSAGYSSALLPDGADVPTLESDELLRGKLDNNDGIDGMKVPLRTAYAGSAVVHYWDFGVTAAGAKPVWVFRQRGADGKPVDFGHHDLVDSIPGDTGYTPFRMVYTVYVTSRYDGQRITSPQALEDALELGLLEEPQWKDSYADWPMALASTELEVGPDEAPVKPRPVYYRGRVASHFKLDDARGPGVFTVEKPPVPTPNLYSLRRQNEAKPLDETAFKLDLNEDGDTTDSNIIFSLKPGDMGDTSLWKQFEVIVPSDYVWASNRAESDLFIRQMWGLDALEGKVIEYSDTTLLFNRPLQRSGP
jgi:hypothetical protein